MEISQKPYSKSTCGANNIGNRDFQLIKCHEAPRILGEQIISTGLQEHYYCYGALYKCSDLLLLVFHFYLFHTFQFSKRYNIRIY